MRPTALPVDEAERLRGRGRRVLYVLERSSLTDLIALGARLPRARPAVAGAALRARRRPRAARGRVPRAAPRLDPQAPRPARRRRDWCAVSAAALAAGDRDVDLVPVSVFWGARHRASRRSWFRLLFREDWTLVGPFRRLLSTLVNGRRTLVRFGEPVSPRRVHGAGPRRAAQPRARAARAMRVEFRNARAAVIGPDLSHRRTVIAEVLRKRAVRAAVALEMRDRQPSAGARRWSSRARYALEIAANYSPRFVAFMAGLLTRVWNRLYDGVEVLHAERLELAVAGRAGRLRAVPSQPHGLPAAVVRDLQARLRGAARRRAASISNLPVDRPLPAQGRRVLPAPHASGAIALYPIVFMTYLGVMMARGHPIEYFIEGGRSRTGRLLQPKTGMLSMTRAQLPRRPARGRSCSCRCTSATSGWSRRRPTSASCPAGRRRRRACVGLLRALRGAAQALRPRATSASASRSRSTDAPRPARPRLAAQRRGRRAPARGSRAAVDANSPPRSSAHQRRRGDLAGGAAAASRCCRRRARRCPRPTWCASSSCTGGSRALAPLFARDVWCTPQDGAAIVAYGRALGLLETAPHALGPVRAHERGRARSCRPTTATTSLHAYALPSLIACAFLNNAAMRTEDVQRLAWRIYPYIAQELFLRWREDEVAGGRRRSCSRRSPGSGCSSATADGSVLAPAARPAAPRRCSCRCSRTRRSQVDRALLPRDRAAAAGRARRDHARMRSRIAAT